MAVIHLDLNLDDMPDGEVIYVLRSAGLIHSGLGHALLCAAATKQNNLNKRLIERPCDTEAK